MYLLYRVRKRTVARSVVPDSPTETDSSSTPNSTGMKVHTLGCQLIHGLRPVVGKQNINSCFNGILSDYLALRDAQLYSQTDGLTFITESRSGSVSRFEAEHERQTNRVEIILKERIARQ